ncbi:hypothetical protein [Streptomyces sp. BRA346]|uniref:hypothetical protein n=1 Tax=Streptomyces sp. BRA346 TaxID=2878199 RepID=UPI0040646E5C
MRPPSPVPCPAPGPPTILTPSGSGTQLTYTEPRTAHDALYFEAAEVARCVAAGLRETPLRPLEESLVTLRSMDEIRRLCGITFDQ